MYVYYAQIYKCSFLSVLLVFVSVHSWVYGINNIMWNIPAFGMPGFGMTKVSNVFNLKGEIGLMASEVYTDTLHHCF